MDGFFEFFPYLFYGFQDTPKQPNQKKYFYFIYHEPVSLQPPPVTDLKTLFQQKSFRKKTISKLTIMLINRRLYKNKHNNSLFSHSFFVILRIKVERERFSKVQIINNLIINKISIYRTKVNQYVNRRDQFKGKRKKDNRKAQWLSWEH